MSEIEMLLEAAALSGELGRMLLAFGIVIVLAAIAAALQELGVRISRAVALLGAAANRRRRPGRGRAVRPRRHLTMTAIAFALGRGSALRCRCMFPRRARLNGAGNVEKRLDRSTDRVLEQTARRRRVTEGAASEFRENSGDRR
jgi:hypothetical protein